MRTLSQKPEAIRKRKLRAKRLAQGLCVICGKDYVHSAFKHCYYCFLKRKGAV